MDIFIVLYLLLGVASGAISGLIGIGGGVLITPALIYLFGFSQYSAQGTSLALLVPPISLLGAWTYYQQGYVDLKVATMVCLGFLLGSLLGAKFAVAMPELLLKRMFGAVMMVIAVRMLTSN